MSPTDPKPTSQLWRGLTTVVSRPIAILLLLQLLSGMLLSPNRTFFPLYIQELGHPVIVLSILATAQQIMGLVGAWFGGALSDALGRKPALLMGQAGALLACLAFLHPALGWIAPLWILSGLGGGVNTVASQSYLIDAAPSAYLGVLSALYNWGSTLGGATSSPLAGLVLERQGFRALGTAMSLLAAVAIVLNVLALPGGRGEGRPVARRSLLGYGDIALRPMGMVLAMLRFLPTCFWGMAVLLIPLLLSAAGASKGTIALYATVSLICASAGQVAVGRAADRLNFKWVTVGVFSLSIAGIVGLALFPTRLGSLFALGTLSTTTAWSLSTLMPSLVARASEPQARGRVLGWLHLWWNLGMIVGSMVGGVLYRVAPGLPFFVAGVLNATALALVFVFFRLATSNSRLSTTA